MSITIKDASKTNHIDYKEKPSARTFDIIIRKTEGLYQNTKGEDAYFFIGNILTCYGIFSLYQAKNFTRLEFFVLSKKYSFEFKQLLSDDQLEEACLDIINHLYNIKKHYHVFKNPTLL